MGFSSDRPMQTNQLPFSIEFPDPSAPEFLEKLTIVYQQIASILSKKESSLYLLEELATSQSYFKYDNAASFTANTSYFRNSYRTTFDLIALNGGNIPIGATNLTLTSTTQPSLIDSIEIPVRGFGAGTIAGPIYVFFNGDDVNVIFDNTVPAAQVIRITNNTGSALTQAYWTMEYLKET